MFGNIALLDAPKTAFLCSRQVSCLSILRCYDWAAETREQGKCVVSGFQSKIEKDVLHFLLKGNQPIIVVLARSLFKIIPEEWKKPISDNRMLIISICPKAIRVSREAALRRNEYILSISDAIVFGYINKDSSLRILQKRAEAANKEVLVLSISDDNYWE